MTLRSGCAAAVALLVALPALALDPCGEWQRVFPWPTDASLEGVAWGHGRFVAVGGGVALTSEDSVIWTPHEVGDGQVWLRDVVWTGDRFTAVGGIWNQYYFDGRFAASADGSSWEVESLPVASPDGLASDGQGFVVIGGIGLDPIAELLYSPDGETWVPGSIPFIPYLSGVAWGNGVWVAGGAGTIRSLDGVTWAWVDSPELYDVVWDGRRFLVLSTTTVLSSPDGLTWTSLGEPPAPRALRCLASNGRRLVAGGGGWGPLGDMPSPGLVTSSADGVTWTVPTEGPRGLRHAVWAEGGWVAVGVDGLLGVSADGETWRWLSHAALGSMADLAAYDAELVVVGGVERSQLFEERFLTSTDGLTWRESAGGFSSLRAVRRVGDLWVAVGRFGTIVRSEDGETWSDVRRDLDVDRDYLSVDGAGDTLVVVGSDALAPLVVTLVGDQASELLLAPEVQPRDVRWDGRQFVVVGDRVLGWSEDGLAWTFTSADANLRKLASDGDRLVAVGEAGTAFWSDDGRTWAPASSGTSIDFTELTWAGDRFVAGSQDGTLLESIDGVAWSPAEPFPLAGLEGLAWTGRELVGVTEEARIARRRCGESTLLPQSAPRQVVPVVAHRAGLAGTFWQSDLHVASASDGWAEVWLGLDATGSGEPEWKRFMLPPGGQFDRRDLVARTFGLDAGAGPLLVASEQPLAVSSRTFTTGASGTYGQAIPALREDQLVAGATSVVVPMLRHDSSYRTNLGLVNASGAPLTLEVELYDAAGNPLGALSSDLGSFGFIQHDGVLAAVGPVADAYAVVSSRDPAARFAAYGSVVDSATGDPTLVLGLAASSDPLVVPAAAHGPGLGGTVWRSDLGVSNPGGVPAAYRLELLAGDASATADFDLGPGQSRRHADVLSSVFGVTGTAAIRVVPTAGAVAVASRTYTPGAGGTFGQGVPVLAERSVIGEGDRVVLAGLAESAAFRSNLGLVNLGDGVVTVTAELYRGDGSLAGTLTRTVPARSLVITSRVFAGVGASEVASGYAVVSTNTAGARLLAWASVVDNGSGDPALMVGR